MALLRNKNLHSLDHAMTQVTEGQPFITWAESIAENLTESCAKTNMMVDIYSLLKKQNIIMHKVDRSTSASNYKALLINKRTHFDLIVNYDKIKNKIELKYVVAHEIAHSIFYHKDSDGLKKSIDLSFGSSQIENACDYIAICLLLPKPNIMKEISDYFIKNDSVRKRNQNFLKFVLHLSAKYQVARHHVLYRIISNFCILNDSLYIEFYKENIWYITWVFQTDSLLNKNLYIPNKSRSKQRYVSAKKSFIEVIDKIYSYNKNNNYGHIVLKKSHFYSYYQGNFKQFLDKYLIDELDIIKIYYRINNDHNISLFFPFDGLIKK